MLQEFAEDVKQSLISLFSELVAGRRTMMSKSYYSRKSRMLEASAAQVVCVEESR